MSRHLRTLTGWALLVAALGIYLDAWASPRTVPDWLEPFVLPDGFGTGSIGLIPAYLGGTVGLACFGAVVFIHAGWRPALLTTAGAAGILAFWWSYPDHATWGGLGSIAIGIAMLALPRWARFVTPIWVASGTLGIPELVRPGADWGPVSAFTLLGTAIGLTGAVVLWGMPDDGAEAPTGRKPL